MRAFAAYAMRATAVFATDISAISAMPFQRHAITPCRQNILPDDSALYAAADAAIIAWRCASFDAAMKRRRFRWPRCYALRRCRDAIAAAATLLPMPYAAPCRHASHHDAAICLSLRR